MIHGETMMRHWSLILLLVSGLLLPTRAWCLHQGPYLQGALGFHLPDTAEGKDSEGSFNLEFNGGLQGAVAVGYDLDPRDNLGDGRVELEWSYRKVGLDQVEFAEGKVPGDGDLTVQSLMLNIFGIYRNGTTWVPYYGGGVGAALVSAANLRASGQPLTDDDDTVFAYQFGLGLGYVFSDYVTLDLGYRFFDLASAQLTEADGRSFDLKYHGHSALLGLRVGF
jgi:opacity protein-like surface antigen